MREGPTASRQRERRARRPVLAAALAVLCLSGTAGAASASPEQASWPVAAVTVTGHHARDPRAAAPGAGLPCAPIGPAHQPGRSVRPTGAAGPGLPGTGVAAAVPARPLATANGTGGHRGVGAVGCSGAGATGSGEAVPGPTVAAGTTWALTGASVGPGRRASGADGTAVVGHPGGTTGSLAGERLVAGPAVAPTAGVTGGPLQTSTLLSAPLALGGLIVLYMVVQRLLGRRDPKIVDAPVSRDDDSVGFE